MHCIVHSSPDSNSHVQLKQQNACFEQGGFEHQLPSPSSSDLAFGHLVADGLNPDLHGGAATIHHREQGNKPQRQAALRIGRYLLVDQLDNTQTLYKAVHTETQEEFVCKVVNKNDSHKILSAHFRLDADHHVNQVEEVLIGDTKTYIFYPRNHGDLYSYVRTRRRLRESEAQSLFRQVAEAVAHCHENGIILRDLKLRKFVFKDTERTTLMLESLEDAVTFDDDDDSLSDKHGCPAYVSPEILTANGRYSGCAADAWSLGVMLFTMLVGRYPFHDTDPSMLFAKIRRGHLVVPECLSSKARCLIRALLRSDPTERFTAADILAHPWFRPTPLDWPVLRCEAKVPDQMVPNGNTVSLFELANSRSTK